ncbi:MAG: MotA/TolQ/ExbB proton channel family protein [Chlamydiales bacterium]|nr:MotA/TolQ/ExbB proton channel family protein [Chlamydiales bacterium]
MEILLYANPIVNAYQESDLLGKLIFLTLFFLSITTWVIFIQKYRLHRAAATHKKYSRLDFNVKPGNHPFGRLYAILQSTSSALLQKKQVLLPKDIEYLRAHLKSTVSKEVVRMEKRVSLLSTIMSLAPFLGLLGTVWGILLTFSELQTGAVANANASVMGGLAMALGTTVLGLIVAIPALIAYNYLRTSIRHFSQEMEDYAQLLVASVEHERT